MSQSPSKRARTETGLSLETFLEAVGMDSGNGTFYEDLAAVATTSGDLKAKYEGEDAKKLEALEKAATALHDAFKEVYDRAEENDDCMGDLEDKYSETDHVFGSYDEWVWAGSDGKAVGVFPEAVRGLFRENKGKTAKELRVLVSDLHPQLDEFAKCWAALNVDEDEDEVQVVLVEAKGAKVAA